MEAYDSVCADFAAQGHLLFPPEACSYRVKITGKFIAFDALAKAVRTNFFPLPPNWTVVKLENYNSSADDFDHVVYLSGLYFQDETPEQITAKIAEEKASLAELGFDSQTQLIFWEQWAREVVSKRGEYKNKFLPKSAEGYLENLEQAFTDYQVVPLSAIGLENANGMVEFGGSFTPSGKGFAVLFHLIISGDLVPEALARYEAMAAYCLNKS